MDPYVQVVSSNLLGEGPHWSDTTRQLYSVDIEGNFVNRYDPMTQQHAKVSITGQENCVSLVVPVSGTDNEFVISTGRDLQRMVWDGVSSSPTSLTNIVSIDPTNPNIRFNDGKCDQWGRLWAGAMSLPGGEDPTGSLYRIQRGVAFGMESGIRISNGIAWTYDNLLMYYIDTPTRRVDVFDFGGITGIIGNRRTVYDFEVNGDAGSPDGMTIDANGHIYVGCWGGSQMLHIDPTTGQKIKSIPFPTENITSAAFGGPNLDILFVTSARSGLSQIDLAGQPAAGSLFQVTNLGVRGQSAGNTYIP